ncbi:MAG TPA: hypothetical protein VEC01_01800 [Noviherbaspirillum sp.]|uniref:hypothetical protein n=1 Tax=Noviherbaspirillum sp. TaxID=1926288 RepID=UPI002D526E06|nr:hypothetical protein [Noviherbaspirillum sp.]HYD94030.1 hypothetical protein [Noviherbaspirillum sp.]
MPKPDEDPIPPAAQPEATTVDASDQEAPESPVEGLSEVARRLSLLGKLIIPPTSP